MVQPEVDARVPREVETDGASKRVLHAGLELWSVDGATTTSPCTRVYCARRTLGVEGSGAERHGHPDDTSSRKPTSLQAGALLRLYGLRYAHMGMAPGPARHDSCSRHRNLDSLTDSHKLYNYKLYKLKYIR